MYDRLKGLLSQLDFFLTHKQSEIYSDDIYENFVYGGTEYYLADGGYSRVVVDSESRKLFLTSNSRDEVKKRWEMHGIPEFCKEIEDEVAHVLVVMFSED